MRPDETAFEAALRHGRASNARILRQRALVAWTERIGEPALITEARRMLCMMESHGRLLSARLRSVFDGVI